MKNQSMGGWEINPSMCPPEAVATGFNQVFEHMVGVKYKPLLYCGSQLVNGTNHMIIAEATLVTNPPSNRIVKIVLHQTIPTEEHINGVFSILKIEQV
ncbi:MAG: hypothetical protein FWE02_07035 [Defluviitaleaceae bacterium]|nr:hypothetical protein [Defluviitaleaceae bacterium]